MSGAIAQLQLPNAPKHPNTGDARSLYVSCIYGLGVYAILIGYLIEFLERLGEPQRVHLGACKILGLFCSICYVMLVTYRYLDPNDPCSRQGVGKPRPLGLSSTRAPN